MTSLDSDQWKQAPGFYRSTSTSPTAPESGNFVWFDGVVPDANSNITVLVDILDSATVTHGINAIQLLVHAANPGSPPTITQDLQPTVAPAGGTATLTVTATGTGLTYQWRKNGVPIQNGGDISGATTATLTINPLNPADVGIYSVVVFSPAGSTVSANASVYISTYNIQDSLVDYFKFDETTGTNANNSATNGAPLPATIFTANTANPWVAGKIGGAYSFDGATWMFVSNYAKASSAISAAAWVNFNGTSPGANVSIIQNAEPSLYTQGGLGLHVVGQFELTLTIDGLGNLYPEGGISFGSDIATVTGTIQVPNTGWHHVAFTADGAQVRIYVDGVLAGSTAYVGTIASPSIPYLSIGARLNADTNSVVGASPNPGQYGSAPIGAKDPAYNTGMLDEVALWDRVLPASEITALFNAGTAGKPLTTIVLTPPATSSKLTASLAAGQITVTWNSGSLQTAPSPAGPWTNVTTTGNSITQPVGPGAKFYRTH